MGGGNRRSSLFTSETDPDAERLHDEELAELREELQSQLGEHESIEGVTSYGTSGSAEGQIEVDPRNSNAPGGRGGAGGGLGVQVQLVGGGDQEGGFEDALPDGVDRDVIAGLAGGPIEDNNISVSPVDLADADTPGEFARRLIADGAVAPRNQSGDGKRLFDPDDLTDAQGMVGGWSEFEYPDENSRNWLDDSGEVTGRTSSFMEIAHLRSPPDGREADAEYDTNVAFITHYDEDARSDADHPPHAHHAGQQIATAAWADALGANVPTHTYDPDREMVAAEAFPGEAAKRASESVCQKVQKDELVDQLAVQMLAGNKDLHSGNIFIADDGTVSCIDLDIAGRKFEDKGHMEGLTDLRAARTIARKGGPEVTSTEVVDRAQEIAVSLHNSGKAVETIEQVQRYEEAVGTSGTHVTDGITNNVDMLVREARIESGAVAVRDATDEETDS